MKKKFSKGLIGSVIRLMKPKSTKIGVLSLIFVSLFLYGAIPYFTGSGLPTPKAIAPYANGVFPVEASLETSNPYRVAYPDLTFFYPIAFKPVPNQNKMILSQLDGQIFWFENDETTQTKNLLMDFSPNVGLISDGGFFGFAIHPDFDIAVNPKNYIYVYYPTKNGNGENSPPFGVTTGQSCDYSLNEHEGNFLMLERFEVDPVTMTAVPNSTTILLKQRLYGTAHYGGGMDFGDDGFLYLTTGDQASWQRSQDIVNNLDGGILRMDVDKDPTKSHPPARRKPIDAGESDEITGVEYWIPNDNPFSDLTANSTTSLYGQPNLDTPNPNDVYASGDFFEEYYTIGLRNPFRMTKDRLTGTFYLGDVGQNTYDEINVVKRGANYGWPLYEGNIPGPGCYTQLFNGMTHEAPLVAFAHADVNAITGGYVYRGSDRPDLYGKYICADYGNGDEIFAVDTDTGAYEEIAHFLPANIISFGEDTDGELFILNLGVDTNIYKLRDGLENYIQLPQLLSETGVFSDLLTLDVIDGIVPYDLYESFWSDGALKRRWIAVPNTDAVHSGVDEQIKYSDFEDWEFPPGTVIIKHFDLPVDDNDPSITKKIETRFSVVSESGKIYFLTYNWNEDQTDAVIQPTSIDETVNITTTTGGTRTQTWHFPLNSECLQCHNDVNNRALGLKARYLNTDYTYAETGITANQLVTLSHLGILDETITDSNTENIITNKAIDHPTATLDEKARSYLDLNCAYCHRFDSGNRANFDLRYFNSTEATNLLNSGIRNALNIDPDEKIVYAGDASKSILFHRMNSVSPNIMMPPISKSIVDQPAVDLIEAWINQLDGLSVTNIPSPYTNIGLLPSAVLSGSVVQGTGRGGLISILYDPLKADYREISGNADYGFAHQQNLGTVDAEDNGLIWRVDWPVPQFLNYLTVGGAFPNDPQPNTMWRISYLRNGNWITIDEGTGGWVNDGIFQWDATNEVPKLAEALQVQLFSDGVIDLVGPRIRGRGGITYDLADTDQGTQPKATLLQFLPYDFPTTIDTIVTGTQTSCDPIDTTYSQELIVTYTNVPDTGSLIVNGQTFPITASPQTITLTGLVADGLDVNVTAEFTDGYNSGYKSTGALFTAPAGCTNLIVGIDETLVIDSDHEVPVGGSIEIMEGGSLTITGNLVNNGDVTLTSVSNKFSSLIVNGSSTGTIKYKRYVNAFNGSTGNDLISSPFSGETFGDFASANPNLFENPNNTSQKLFGPFDESSGNYLTYSTTIDASTTLDSGVGYRGARDTLEDGVSGLTLTFNGTIETGTITLPITESSTAFSGWNLIGNPYPSYIDFDTFFNLNKTQLDVSQYQAIYGYDGDANDGWAILNNVTTGQLIAPGQGFFVKVKPGGGTITFTPAMRVSGDSDDFILGRNASHFGHMKLRASTNSVNYNTDFYFNSNATSRLDPGYDAGLYGENLPPFSIYSYLVEDNEGTAFSIQALNNSVMESITIPLGINAGQGQEVTISIFETDLSESINVYLEDTANNTFTLLNSNDYVFTADSDISGIGRFYLRTEGLLSVIDSSLKDLNIFFNKNQEAIVINGQIANKTNLTLFDIHGRIVATKELELYTSDQNIDVSHLSKGIYITQLETLTNEKRIHKLIIR